MPRSPHARSLAAKIAAETSWANTPDPSARTAPGRAAFDERFERQVDPDGVLDAQERARRAEHARKAHFARMALRSAESRRKAGEARGNAVLLDREADAADAELASGGEVG